MPHRFARRWLAFDESRPTRTRLVKRFVLVLIAMLLTFGGLALLTAR